MLCYNGASAHTSRSMEIRTEMRGKFGSPEPRGRSLVPFPPRSFAIWALASVVVFSGYGSFAPAELRCALPGAVGCPGGWLGPPATPAATGTQWFNITASDYAFYITDTVTGANESNAWNLFEGYTVNVNATSLPPDASVGGTNQHGVGVYIGSSGLLYLAAPVGSWASGSFVAPSSPSSGNEIYCTIYCGPGHSSQRFNIVNVVAPPPQAVASGSPTSGSVPLTVSFTGSASGGSSPYTYSWNFGDGSPASTTQNPSHTYTVAGSYTAVLTVTDSTGASSTARVQITASAPASLSASVTAQPTSGTAPLKVSFTGSASGGVAPYNYSWSFGDGSTGSGTSVTHTYASVGNYSATLTVTDSSGTKATKSTPISVVASLPPLPVTASAQPSSGSAPLAVTLTATPSGGTSPYTATWQFGDGSSGSGLTATHTYSVAGSYRASVTVTDATGRIGTTTAYVNVTGGASAPLSVVATTNASGGSAPLPITAYASIQGGSGIYSTVSWTFGDGSTGTGSTVTHTFTTPGTFTLNVTVTDSAGHTAKNSTTVTVAGAAPLTLLVSLNATSGDAPFMVNASASVFGGNSHFSQVHWSWGDGTTSTGTAVNHTYPVSSVGTFTVTATVSDTAGASASNSTQVQVQPEDTATIMVNTTSSYAPTNATFVLVPGSGSDINGSKAQWSFGNGVNTTAPFTTSTTYLHPGSYLVTARTTDLRGLWVSATIRVNVSAPPGSGGPSASTVAQTPSVLGNGVGDPVTDALALIFFLSLGLLYLLVTGPHVKSPPKGKVPPGKATPKGGRSTAPSNTPEPPQN